VSSFTSTSCFFTTLPGLTAQSTFACAQTFGARRTSCISFDSKTPGSAASTLNGSYRTMYVVARFVASCAFAAGAAHARSATTTAATVRARQNIRVPLHDKPSSIHSGRILRHVQARRNGRERPGEALSFSV